MRLHFYVRLRSTRNKISMNYYGDDERKVMVVQAQVISRCFVKVTSDSSSLSIVRSSIQLFTFLNSQINVFNSTIPLSLSITTGS